MKILDILKGVFRRMFSSKDLEDAMNLQPAISSKMKEAIELWEAMYKDESPWLNENDFPLKSLGLAAMIASEKARTATIEMDIKVTGDSELANFIKDFVENKLVRTVRKNLEYGIALGGLVIKPYVYQGLTGKYEVGLTYVKATDFYPLAFNSEGDVREAAFIDRIITKEDIYSKVELVKLVGTELHIVNRAFRTHTKDQQLTSINRSELGNPVSLSSIPEWANITENVVINDADSLMFAYFKMPQANTIDLCSPLGVSGFAKAVNLIRDADELYSDLLWEFEGGQLAIDVDRTAVNPMLDSTGRPMNVLPKLQDRLFRRNLDLGDDEVYNVFSPALRDKNIINGLNTTLMHIEDVCDLSRGTLSEVTYAEARTATELRILKQRSYSANVDIQKELENAIKDVIKIVDKYCYLYNIVPRGEYDVAYVWDDSIIVDKDAERQVDMVDVTNGLLSKVEYRMKWMGETEEQATEALKKIDDQRMAEMEAQQQMMAKYTDADKSDSGQGEHTMPKENNS